MSNGIRNGRRLVPMVLGMAVLAGLWSCDGQNLFGPSGSVVTGGDGDTGFPPEIVIQQPQAPAARPIGDSVLVTAWAKDDLGVDSVLFGGIAFRGDVNLGTDTIVQRYIPKMVRFTGTSRDTVVSRYLNAAADGTRETSVLFAIAFDSQGNIASDSLNLIIGGPRVQFLTISEAQQIQAGLSLNLQVEAMDPEGVLDLLIEVTGAFEKTILIPFNPPLDTVRVDTAVVIPAGVTGTVEVTATARNGLDVSGQDGPISLEIVSSNVGDQIPPTASMVASGSERLELTDLITLEVSGTDDTQGSGVAQIGYTVKGISPERGDTLVQTDNMTYSPARTGKQTTGFTFSPFNVDELNLPDTLIYEVTGWVVDGDGNCSAVVLRATTQELGCTTLPGGQRVAEGRTGLRLTHVAVSGRTVGLPSGGKIMDAVVDTTRKTLLLSNIERNRVEVFRLENEVFGSAIGVGSEPWGLSLNRAGDQLLVANSGGTNISIVDLDQERELEQQRFFAPDAVIFDLELKEGDSGFSFIIYPFPTLSQPSFSDRPQYIAVDFFGNIVFSTKTTSIGNIGTARKAYLPPGAARAEVKLFVEHGENGQSEDFWAIAHIDSIGAGVDTLAVDSLGNPTLFAAGLTLFDHKSGFPDSIISATANTSMFDPVEGAWASLANQGSDIYVDAGARWDIRSFGFADTTYVTASGDGRWVLIGEGSTTPVGRVMMYRAAQMDTTDLSSTLRVWDQVINSSEIVSGVGLNYDGTLGVARGQGAYFFDNELQLNGVVDLTEGGGGAGAALHPLHANQRTLENFSGTYRPDTHLAFIGTDGGTIDIIDTFKFTRIGQITIRDRITGPLRAVLPFPEDNAGLTCATIPVTGMAGNSIGTAIRLYEGEDFVLPLAPDGATDDACIVIKLFATTSANGVVVVPVRKVDILKYHPNRSGN